MGLRQCGLDYNVSLKTLDTQKDTHIDAEKWHNEKLFVFQVKTTCAALWAVAETTALIMLSWSFR